MDNLDRSYGLKARIRMANVVLNTILYLDVSKPPEVIDDYIVALKEAYKEVIDSYVFLVKGENATIERGKLHDQITSLLHSVNIPVSEIATLIQGKFNVKNGKYKFDAVLDYLYRFKQRFVDGYAECYTLLRPQVAINILPGFTYALNNQSPFVNNTYHDDLYIKFGEHLLATFIYLNILKVLTMEAAGHLLPKDCQDLLDLIEEKYIIKPTVTCINVYV